MPTRKQGKSSGQESRADPSSKQRRDAKGEPIVVIVRPLPKSRNIGMGNVRIGPHFDELGKQLGEAFEKMVNGIHMAKPDEFKVTLGLTLEGSTNWVLVQGKVGASLAIEATWKTKPNPPTAGE